MPSLVLPALTPDHEPTRASLHAYALAVAALPRAHAVPHPLWWHASLTARPEGLVGDPVPLPGGGALAVRLDPMRHEVVLASTAGDPLRLDLRDLPTATQVGDHLIAAAAELGLEGPVDRERFADDARREYEPTAARDHLLAFLGVQSAFARHRASLGARVGPIQVWPHGFDLAVEWFGTRTALHHGEEAPAQLNLGFYPAGEPYLYSNPWPFDPSLTGAPLPEGARWVTEPFQGSLLPYHDLVGDPAAGERIVAYARAVFAAAAPTLEAP